MIVSLCIQGLSFSPEPPATQLEAELSLFPRIGAYLPQLRQHSEERWDVILRFVQVFTSVHESQPPRDFRKTIRIVHPDVEERHQLEVEITFVLRNVTSQLVRRAATLDKT